MPANDPIYKIAFCDLHAWQYTRSGGNLKRFETSNGSRFCDHKDCMATASVTELDFEVREGTPLWVIEQQAKELHTKVDHEDR